MGVHPDGLENILNDLGIMEEGWTKVKFEPVPVEHFVASSNRCRPFENGDIHA